MVRRWVSRIGNTVVECCKRFEPTSSLFSSLEAHFLLTSYSISCNFSKKWVSSEENVWIERRVCISLCMISCQISGTHICVCINGSLHWLKDNKTQNHDMYPTIPANVCSHPVQCIRACASVYHFLHSSTLKATEQYPPASKLPFLLISSTVHSHITPNPSLRSNLTQPCTPLTCLNKLSLLVNTASHPSSAQRTCELACTEA